MLFVVLLNHCWPCLVDTRMKLTCASLVAKQTFQDPCLKGFVWLLVKQIVMFWPFLVRFAKHGHDCEASLLRDIYLCTIATVFDERWDDLIFGIVVRAVWVVMCS